MQRTLESWLSSILGGAYVGGPVGILAFLFSYLFSLQRNRFLSFLLLPLVVYLINTGLHYFAVFSYDHPVNESLKALIRWTGDSIVYSIETLILALVGKGLILGFARCRKYFRKD
jgi:hypothetical protein